MKIDEIRVGDYVRKKSEPRRVLKIISTPYMFGGQAVVTARRGNGGREGLMVGMYAVDALEPWPGPTPGPGGFPALAGRGRGR